MIRKVYEVEKREVFLRAFLVVLCLLEGRVYLKLDGLEISGNLCRFLVIDLVGFGVIPSF